MKMFISTDKYTHYTQNTYIFIERERERER